MLNIISNPDKLARWLLYGSCLLLLLWLVLPAVVLAQSPDLPAGDTQQCIECHEDETATWQDSPHATGAVQCEACHGAYVKDHPKDGIMQLGVDSASCQECHAETYEQWQDSAHGEANVQCISCHLPHSQEFRLTDEALCETCHRHQLNDFAHATHTGAELACTDCHLSMASRDLTGSADLTAVTGGGDPPNHSFVVTSQTCIDCHERAPAKSVFHTSKLEPKDSDQAPELLAKLKAAEQANLALKGMSVAGLGAGLGIGGMLGIVFVFVAGRLHQRRM